MGTRFNAFAIACAAALASQGALAEPPKPIGPFSSLCQEKASVGFSWEKGQWKQTGFNVQRYIVRKIVGFKVGPQDDGSMNWCNDHDKPADFGDDKIYWVGGCYTARPIGQLQWYHWCSETYEKAGATWGLTSIVCDEARMAFVPNGMFEVAHMAGDISPHPKNDERDTLAVGYGDCGVIG